MKDCCVKKWCEETIFREREVGLRAAKACPPSFFAILRCSCQTWSVTAALKVSHLVRIGGWIRPIHSVKAKFISDTVVYPAPTFQVDSRWNGSIPYITLWIPYITPWIPHYSTMESITFHMDSISFHMDSTTFHHGIHNFSHGFHIIPHGFHIIPLWNP